MPERPWGYWTEQKLAVRADYLPRFTTASKRAAITAYLGLFAGDVENVSRGGGNRSPGARAPARPVPGPGVPVVYGLSPPGELVTAEYGGLPVFHLGRVHMMVSRRRRRME